MGKLIDTWTNNQVLLSTDSVYFFFPLNQQINVNICPHWEIRTVLLSRIEIISFENSVCLDKPSNVWTIDGPRKFFHLTISINGNICDCRVVDIWISKVTTGNILKVFSSEFQEKPAELIKMESNYDWVSSPIENIFIASFERVLFDGSTTSNLRFKTFP